jgi:hypothetical protein
MVWLSADEVIGAALLAERSILAGIAAISFLFVSEPARNPPLRTLAK